MEQKLSDEKLIKVAKALGIETLGKKEEEIRESILEHTKPKTNTQADIKLSGFFRGLGKALGELELIQSEITSDVIETKRKPLIQVIRPISVEKTFRLAKVLGIDVQGKKLYDIQEEIRRVLGI